MVLERRYVSLCCHDVGCRRARRVLFAHIDFELSPGDALRVTGDNGSGKTTLLRVLAGLGRPDAGLVCWHGRDVRHAHSGYRDELLFFGHAAGVKGELTACENLIHLDNLTGPGGRQAARAALQLAGLGAHADLPVRLLSQGQRRRVALARTRLPRRRGIWIMDEPFVGLDAVAADALCATLREHRAGGGIVVYTTHQDLGPADARRLTLGLPQRC
jgi:heme exporter protein A